MPLFWKPYKSDVTLVHRGAEGEEADARGRAARRAARCCGTAVSTARPETEYEDARVRSSPTSTRPSSAERGSWVDDGRARRGRAEAAEVVDSVAVARLYGEPLFAMPHGPVHPAGRARGLPRGLRGPARPAALPDPRQNFNILDIPLASVTRQYLAYVEQIRTRNLELASEYLLMAAMLIEIKSRMLLPPKKSADGEEPEDPRAELVRRLIEYEQMKLAAARLDALPRDRPRLPARPGDDRADRWRRASPTSTPTSCATPGPTSSSAPSSTSTTSSRASSCSVREHMSIVLRAPAGPRASRCSRTCSTSTAARRCWSSPSSRMLELAREHLLEVTQAEAFAPIYVRLAYQPT